MNDQVVRQAIFDAHGKVDFWTRKPISFSEMALDHVVPASKGGPDNLFNLVPTTSGVNSAKRDRYDHIAATAVLGIIRTHYGWKALRLIREKKPRGAAGPYCWVIVGRGRSGKALLAHWLASESADHRPDACLGVVAIDGTSSALHQHIKRTQSMPYGPVGEWLFDALQAAGDGKHGAIIVSSHSDRIVEGIEQASSRHLSGWRNYRVALCHVVGPEPADWTSIESGAWRAIKPDLAVVALNEGLASSVQGDPFSAFLSSPVYQDAVASNIQTIRIPRMGPDAVASWSGGQQPLSAKASEQCRDWARSMRRSFSLVSDALP